MKGEIDGRRKAKQLLSSNGLLLCIVLWIIFTILFLYVLFECNPNWRNEGVDFLSNNLSDILVTTLGVLLGGVLSLVMAFIMYNRQVSDQYEMYLRSLFSEFQDNERVLRQGSSMNVFIAEKKYSPKIVLLGSCVLNGFLSSNELGFRGHHKLTSSLTTIERKIAIHNELVRTLLGLLSQSNFDKNNLTFWEVSDENLREKQKILRTDLVSMMEVITEIVGEKSISRYLEVEE